MGQLDHQLGVVDESVYGTLVTPTRFFEYNSESIAETEGRTEGDPLRSGTFVQRNDRFTPYFSGAAGTVQLDVMTKGFGFFLKHMLGTVTADAVAADSVYDHVGTIGEMVGDSFTMQINRPFHPAGTNQAFAYTGGKVTKWTLSNSVDGNLVCDLDVDFSKVDTATALASASYPTGMENLTWAGGVVSIGGSAYDVTEISIAGDNALNVDRRQIRGDTAKKEPTAGRRMLEFSLSADFDSMTQRNRAHATTRSAALAALVCTWTGPTLAGVSAFPKLTVTIPAARFDSWSGATEGTEGISQELSGVVRDNGTDEPITLEYTTVDTTP